MSELAEKILLELEKNEKLESLKFANQTSTDHQVNLAKYFLSTINFKQLQKIVGAIKSLESLGDVICSQMETVKRWRLTGEGEQAWRILCRRKKNMRFEMKIKKNI